MWIGSYNKSSRLQNNFVVVYSFVIATYTNVTFLLVMQGKRPCKTNVKRRLNLSSPRNINTRFLNMLLHVNHRCSRRVFRWKLTQSFITNTKVQKHYSCNIQISSYISNIAYIKYVGFLRLFWNVNYITSLSTSMHFYISTIMHRFLDAS